MSAKVPPKKRAVKPKSVEDDNSPSEDEQKVRQRLRRNLPEMMPKAEHSRGLLNIVIERLNDLESLEAFDERTVKREISFCLRYLKELQDKM